MLILFFLLVLNLAISFWNASAVGRYWSERDELPFGVQFLMWCGVIMAVCGFFSVYITVIAIVMQTFGLVIPYVGLFGITITAAEADLFIQSIMNLAYLMIIFPILGSGLAIWANSVAVAIAKRDLLSIGVAGYNTFAMAHNTINAIRYVPEASADLGKALGKLFSGSGKKSGGLVLILALILPIIISLGGAIATTVVIMQASDEKYQLEAA